MTVSALPPVRRVSAAPGSPGRLRLAVCAATVAACVPYLSIKAAWLSGSTVGWNDADAARESALYVGNAISLAMDATAVLVALAFTFPWGRRVPAWLVLVPMWVAAGLLAPIALAVPLGSVLQVLFSSQPLVEPGGALQGWVYGVVYTGFTLQGAGLVTAFVLYARDRWAFVFAVRAEDVPRGATHRLQVLLARTAAVFAALFAAVHLFWAFGGTAGLIAEEHLSRGPARQTVDGVMGLLALVGAAALLALVGRARRFAVPLAGAWVGAAATFSWSLYLLIVTVAQPGHLGAHSTAAVNLTLLCGVLAGLLMGVTGAVLLAELAERDAQIASPTASSTP
ncbi:hypothetical protein [Actinomadura chibensis]|uniref:Uncharacterized protein n=1 Tax=Actinomadura chibensis TaxID=392828 RepID=A0A5D0NGQ9_9ACTN|nr:hypothetical protein [Actinomadura chibensis]TYB43435.1 hypothetical protein FXF69_26875 [Actinomadura chibensis]